MPDEIRRLIGVYDADGSFRGELSYFVRVRLGRAHCALCDITHGRVRERQDWRASRARLPVPIALFHRDDEPPSVRAAAGGERPVVVAELADQGVVPLLDAGELERVAGSPDRFVDAVTAAAAAAGLRWPP